MRARQTTPTPILRCRKWVAVMLASALGGLFTPGMAMSDVSYYIFERATSVHTRTAEIEATSTNAIPAVVIAEPEPADDPAPPVPLPGVTIEVFDADTGSLLGAGRANREGYYNLTYNRPAEADHRVRFLGPGRLEDLKRKKETGFIFQHLSAVCPVSGFQCFAR